MWAQNRLNEASVVPCTSVLDCANYPSPCWWFARTAAEGCTGREAQRHIRKRLGFRAACCRLLCDTSAQLGAVLCAVIHSFNFDHGTVRCDPDSCVELCAALFQVSWLDCCASYLTCVIATILLLLCGTYLPEHGQAWCLSPPHQIALVCEFLRQYFPPQFQAQDVHAKLMNSPSLGSK
ncbi:hypothetical protein TRVL_03902 [Trypanosoma vivax]|nr:hypothetical protein TRVL_03902 [Trypanosoma vivax]